MMAVVAGFSIDTSGVWSVRKAQKVIEALKPEAEAMGLELVTLDVTVFGDLFPKVLIYAQCTLHGIPVQRDAICEMCRWESA